jgi:hypothetical protein
VTGRGFFLPDAPLATCLPTSDEKAPSIITPEAFSFLEVVLPLSLQVSPTVIWFILEHTGI